MTRGLRAGAAAAVLACAIPATASAHAIVVKSIPGGGERLAKAPPRVRVVFDDPVQVGPGNEAVRNGGRSILGAPPSARGRTLVLPIRTSLRTGTYTVRRSIISDDGHNELGVFAFSIGLGAVAAPSLRASEPVDRVVVAVRWIFLACLLASAGLALFELLVARWSVGSFVPARLLAALPAGVAASGALLVHLSGAGMSTRFGLTILIAVAVATVGSAAALVAPRRSVALVIPLTLLAVPTVAGHALDAAQSWVEVPIDLLHVTAVAFWLGSLLAWRSSRSGRRIRGHSAARRWRDSRALPFRPSS